MNNELFIYSDGGARGNPGPAAIGVVVQNASRQTIEQLGQKIGETTNNVAEYQAVLAALKLLVQKNLRPTKITFFLDSLLVCQQLNGVYKIKQAHLKDLFLKVRAVENELASQIFYKHIPREQNREADGLVNQALDSSS